MMATRRPRRLVLDHLFGRCREDGHITGTDRQSGCRPSRYLQSIPCRSIRAIRSVPRKPGLTLHGVEIDDSPPSVKEDYVKITLAPLHPELQHLGAREDEQHPFRFTQWLSPRQTLSALVQRDGNPHVPDSLANRDLVSSTWRFDSTSPQAAATTHACKFCQNCSLASIGHRRNQMFILPGASVLSRCGVSAVPVTLATQELGSL